MPTKTPTTSAKWMKRAVSSLSLAKASAELNEYAVEARYPGNYEPVGEKEYHAAIALAENVVKWAQSKLKGS